MLHGRTCKQRIFWSYNICFRCCLWVLMEIRSYASAKEKTKKLKGLKFGTFTGSFSNDIMAVKGLSFRSDFVFTHTYTNSVPSNLLLATGWGLLQSSSISTGSWITWVITIINHAPGHGTVSHNMAVCVCIHLPCVCACVRVRALIHTRSPRPDIPSQKKTRYPTKSNSLSLHTHTHRNSLPV